MNSETVVKQWGIICRKDELIRRHGSDGQKMVSEALSFLTQAKTANPFIMYENGFETLEDISKSIVLVLKKKKEYPDEIVDKAVTLYNKILKSAPIILYDIGIKKFNKIQILKSYIIHKHFFDQKVGYKEYINAEKTLKISGMIITLDFLQKYDGVDSASAKKIIKVLKKFKVIYDSDPYEIITKKILSKSQKVVVNQKLGSIFKKSKSLKMFIHDIEQLKKIKLKYREIKKSIVNFRKEGEKQPFILFFRKRKIFKSNEEVRRVAGHRIYTYLDSFKSAFNNSNIFKGINFSGLTPILTDIELTSADLSYCNYSGITIENCALSRCYLYKTKLKGVKFINCKLDETDFSESLLIDSEFTDCDLSYTKFDGATMNNCRFSGNNKYTKTSFNNANLEGSSFSDKAFFYGLDFTSVNLQSATIRNCKFSECSFDGGNLKKMFAIGVSLIKCSFHNADLSGSKMDRSDLSESDFYKAVLSRKENESCFNGVNMIKTDLSYARIDRAELHQVDFLASNLYLTIVDDASFKKAKNISGTEQPHIVVGDVSGQEIVHRATLKKRLKEMGFEVEDVHKGKIEIEDLKRILDSNDIKKLMKFLKNEGAHICEKFIKYNFLNPQNLTKIREWFDKEMPEEQDKIIPLLMDEDFIDKEDILLKTLTVI